jgi:uncharacterized OsmC-like protein
LKLKAEIDDFEIISGQTDENPPQEGPSPSSLMNASLGLSAGLDAAWYLKKHNIHDDGLTVEVDTLDLENPSGVRSFSVKVNVKADLSEEARADLLASINSCYVGKTMKENTSINYELNIESPFNEFTDRTHL